MLITNQMQLILPKTPLSAAICHNHRSYLDFSVGSVFPPKHITKCISTPVRFRERSPRGWNQMYWPVCRAPFLLVF